MAFWSGKDGGFKSGAVAQKFAKWDLEVNAMSVDVSNFTSQGFRERITGLIDGKIAASGPYDPAIALPQPGTSGALELIVGGTIKFTVTAVITRAKFSQDVNGAAQVELAAETTGVFDINLAA